ncbi:MAG: glycosyltransferase family 2 protein [Rickettsiales bacterium]|nr:glycosyltransferase family 2 protein [Pseudomonadota bacterium]MDA0966626.1 glycosyltransferase family 2 protein [Pseudomonadota bacterium]MDG4543654.1 glycosyltransferase family 2 protein [Rickettsiales bacterium]MDG4545801.1 glycosyltransferase family 2 protein [Rickettsiales bacterium]MDG4547425.1 glycosyltransferase family 2 protein [Rickettsiales bacterium]
MQKHSASKKVSVVIVTYNSAKVIEECLKSIPDGMKVYVIDNASKDSTCKIVKETRPNAILIQNDSNIGFGCANNVALEKIDTEFALLLNPDAILEKDSIQKLVQAAEKYEEAAIIAPNLYNDDGSLQQSYKTAFYVREETKAKYIAPSGDLCAECLSGAVMLLRMKHFKKIGFFDPKIFLFYEDDDLCLKAMNAGYSLVLTPDSEVTHIMGASTPKSNKIIFFKNKHMLWSRLYLEEKYFNKGRAKYVAFCYLYFYLAKFFLKFCSFQFTRSMKSLGSLTGCLYYLFGIKP